MNSPSDRRKKQLKLDEHQSSISLPVVDGEAILDDAVPNTFNSPGNQGN